MSASFEGVKLAVIYYSMTGTNYNTAKAFAEAAEQAGAEVRLRKTAELAPAEVVASVDAWKKHHEDTSDVPVASNDDLDWADAVILGTPTRYGNVASQMKQFIDSTGPLWAEGKLVNKVVASFTSAQNTHGGQESTLLALNNSMYHWGSIIVPLGYTDAANFQAGGNPYGVSITADGSALSDEKKKIVEVQVQRVLHVAAALKNA